MGVERLHVKDLTCHRARGAYWTLGNGLLRGSLLFEGETERDRVMCDGETAIHSISGNTLLIAYSRQTGPQKTLTPVCHGCMCIIMGACVSSSVHVCQDAIIGACVSRCHHECMCVKMCRRACHSPFIQVRVFETQ